MFEFSFLAGENFDGKIRSILFSFAFLWKKDGSKKNSLFQRIVNQTWNQLFTIVDLSSVNSFFFFILNGKFGEKENAIRWNFCFQKSKFLNERTRLISNLHRSSWASISRAFSDCSRASSLLMWAFLARSSTTSWYFS